MSQRETKRRAARWLAAVLGITAMTVTFALVADPVGGSPPPGLFELDGNVTPIATTDGDDWGNVFYRYCQDYPGTYECTNPVPTAPDGGVGTAYAYTFVPDPVGSAESSFFTGGGSKDTNDVSEWLYDTVNDVVPDKDDLQKVFAAAYDKTACYPDPQGGPCVDETHTFFYFGADRYDGGDGSAQLGFWFFRTPVGLGAPNASGVGPFTGTHNLGDLLVLVDITKGGHVDTLTVYQWNPLFKNNLELLVTMPAADCGTAAPGSLVCAIMNKAPIATEPPWKYVDKDGPLTYGEFALLEIGLDVTVLFRDYLNLGEIGCFASFLAETRSSGSSVEAQLKDLALGGFGVCSIDAVKTGDALSKIGDPVTFTVSVENTGHATLFLQDVVDDKVGAIFDEGVKVYAPASTTCGASLAPGATCTITIPFTIPAGAADPFVNTVTVTYREHLSNTTFSGLELSAVSSHTTNLFQPSVTIDKSGPEKAPVGATVTYTFLVTNTSSSDTPQLLLDSVTDTLLGNLAPAALSADCGTLVGTGATCSFTAERTVLAGDPETINNTVTIHYHPDGFPNDVPASDSHAVNKFTPELLVEKSVSPELSKIGDEVTYTFVITNTSSSFTPPLVLQSLTDDVLGDLAGAAPAACDTLAYGASCTFTVPWTVAAVDVNPADGTADDPVVNTVTAVYDVTGFAGQTVQDTDSASLNLFTLEVNLTKEAEALSKIGDEVTYTLSLTNNSSADAPALSCRITDAMLGVDETRLVASSSSIVPIVVNHTIPQGAADPLENTASVACTIPGGVYPNVVNDSAAASVNLFTPGVLLTKTVSPIISKIGDQVTYTFFVQNTGSADSPDLTLQGFSDDVLGDLKAVAIASGCDGIGPGDSCSFTVPWTVQAVDIDVPPNGADNPIVNTATVLYTPFGFPNQVQSTDTAALTLFSPNFTIAKVGPEKSKPGDVINYVITVTNTTTAPAGGDVPALSCTVTDPKLSLSATQTIAFGGAPWVINAPYTVQAGDPDPLLNTASATCTLLPDAGLPNSITKTASESVDLFYPGVTLDKTGPAYTKPGDTANYTIRVDNTSSADTPDLVCTITDTRLAGSPWNRTIASGGFAEIAVAYAVPVGTTDTALDNTASVTCSPTGYSNEFTDSDSVRTTVLHPALMVSKICKPGTEPVPQDGPAVFSVTIQNTGDATIVVDASEADATLDGTYAAGQSRTADVTVAGDFTGMPFVGNTVTVSATLDATLYGEFPNVLGGSSTATCEVAGEARVIKTVKLLPPSGDQDFTFQIRTGATLYDPGTILETEHANAGNLGSVTFDLSLVPGATYQLCEASMMPGWSTTLGGFVPDSYLSPGVPDPFADNSVQCVDFSVAAGATAVFEVDNSYPEGDGRTIGFWKNWSACSGGRQDWVLEETLHAATPPGIQIGLVDLSLASMPTGCTQVGEWAVNLLAKSTIDTRQKMAGNALFNMAAQLLGAQLNYAAGAYTCPAITAAMANAQAFLIANSFDGLSSGKKNSKTVTGATAACANYYAGMFDAYNNNWPDACSMPPSCP